MNNRGHSLPDGWISCAGGLRPRTIKDRGATKMIAEGGIALKVNRMPRDPRGESGVGVGGVVLRDNLIKELRFFYVNACQLLVVLLCGQCFTKAVVTRR